VAAVGFKQRETEMSGRPRKKIAEIPGHTHEVSKRKSTALNSAPSKKNAPKGRGRLTSECIGRFITSMQIGPGISNH
jgi:hypothetical protein